MKKMITIVLVTFVSFSFAQDTLGTYHRAKIYFSHPDQLRQLEDAEISIDHGIKKKNTFIESDFSEREIENVKSLGFKVEIIINDIKAYYLQKNSLENSHNRNASCTNNSITYTTPSNFDVFPSNHFGGYYTYSQLLQELDDMATLYPNLITAKADIGSFLTDGTPDNSTTPSIGGNGIKWVKISDNPNSSENEPQVLYTALHHAREPSTLSQLVFYMWYLLENYDSDDEIKAIVDNTELFFVPVVNPDGYLYNEKTDPQGGGFWRKNRKNSYGVDNNRNYNYFINGDSNNGTWGGPGSSGSTSSDLYRGTAPFSEIENQAIKWLVEQHNFVVALNNHSFGQLLYHPFSYADVATSEEALFKGITGLMVSQNGYANLRGFPFSGESDDFMYGTVGTHSKIYAMTSEVGASFWPAASKIEDISKDMMFLNLTTAHLAGNYATITDISPQYITATTTTANYAIKRLGLQSPANFTVSVNPISSNIISTGSANIHNGLAHSEQANGNISLDLNSSINTGDIISYELIINNGLYDKSVLIEKIYGQPAVELNEMGNSTSTNWTTSGWAITTEDFVSALTSITDSPTSNYSSNENSTITLLNPIDLSGALAANLSFQAKWDIEPNWDYVQLEVSTNNGSTWIPQCGNYTNKGVENQNSAAGEPLYDGSQTDWVLETIDLSDYLDESILIRFRLVTDAAVNEDGFYFDDLKVKVLHNNLGLDDALQNSFKIYPNPVNSALYLNSRIQDYSISLYNIQGQLMYESRHNNNDIVVDYTNYASGLYFLNIRTKDSSKSFKILKN